MFVVNFKNQLARSLRNFEFLFGNRKRLLGYHYCCRPPATVRFSFLMEERMRSAERVFHNCGMRNLSNSSVPEEDSSSSSSAQQKHRYKGSEEEKDTEPEEKTKSRTASKDEDDEFGVGGAIVRRGHLFVDVPEQHRNKKSFETAIGMFLYKNNQRRGHVEFIESALRYMEEFGVHKDLEIYKKLMDIFPKGKMHAQNMWQLDMWHFPKHQYCAIDLLDQMEYWSVYGDQEMTDIVKNAFGEWSYVGRKMKRMMYWGPKFKNLNPYFIPRPTPTDGLELAKYAVRLMCRDPANILSVWLTKQLKDSAEDTWIVSGQSPQQQEHIQEHDPRKPVYVDGPFRVWVREHQVSYFVLLADDAGKNFADQFENTEQETVEYWKSWRRELKSEYPAWRRALWALPSIHQQSDGTVLGICATGTSTKDSLAAWIKFLQSKNPALKQITVVFRMKHLGPDVITLEELRKQSQMRVVDAQKGN